MTLLLQVNIFFYQKTWIKKNIYLLKSTACPACKDKKSSSAKKSCTKASYVSEKELALSGLSLPLFRSNSFFSMENSFIKPYNLQGKIKFFCKEAGRWWLSFGLQNDHAGPWLLYLWNPLVSSCPAQDCILLVQGACYRFSPLLAGEDRGRGAWAWNAPERQSAFWLFVIALDCSDQRWLWCIQRCGGASC